MPKNPTDPPDDRPASPEAAGFPASLLEPVTPKLPEEGTDRETPERAPGTDASNRVLLVDDDDDVRECLAAFLADKGFAVQAFRNPLDGLGVQDLAAFPVAIVDLSMPEMSGLQVLERLKELSPDTEVIIMTGHASVDTAVEAIRLGAYDYLRKPFQEMEQVCVAVRRAQERRRLSLGNRQLVADMQERNVALSTAVTRLTSLIEAGRAMSGIEDLCDLLDFFIGLVSRELDVDRASLMLVDEQNRELTIAASRGINDQLAQSVRVRLGEGIAGWVAKEGKPILVKDVTTDPRIKEVLRSARDTSFISAPIVLSIPIMVQARVLGVINVTNKRSGKPFQEEDMAFLYGLAGQAAVSIEKARHYNELKQAYESLKGAQEQLVAAERLKALGQMAAGVAHDFNNILNGILGKAELLVMKLSEKQLDRHAIGAGLEMIQQITLQGAETVKRVQDFTRIRKDQPSHSVDVNAVIRNAVEMTRPKWKYEAESRGVAIDLHLKLAEIPPTTGNPPELIQVVSNLIFNAVEAMPSGGRLTVRSRLEEEKIVVEIADTGTGMDKETQSRIFEPFFTTKETGQGLGMSIVYGILARHGGEIAVDSREGEGTTFTFRLPVRSARPVGEEASGPRKEAVAPACILVVDDDDLNLKLLQEALLAKGHQTIAVASGQEAIAVFEREEIDLVLTDLSMPGMSGWQVAKEVKRRRKDVPVVLLSGWAIQQEEAQVRESGVDFIISKPCSLKTLQSTVEEALRGRVRGRA